MNDQPSNRDQQNPEQDNPKLESRRDFLKGSAYLGTIGATGFLSNASFISLASAGNSENKQEKRAKQAYQLRVNAAEQHYEKTLALPIQENNGDDKRYRHDNFYASFTKTMEHNQFGEVNPSAYKALVKATRTGRDKHFEAIPLDANADRTLANPQGAFRNILSGLDGHATRMRPAPTFRSAESAGEMGELYWQTMTRDVPFNQYDAT